MRLWHYTIDRHYNNIVKTGYIKQATIGIDKDEKPAVWLSSNSDYENSVKKTLINQETGEILKDLGREELFKHSVDVIRLEVDSSRLRLFNWLQFKEVSGISEKSIIKLETLSDEWNDNPLEWYACFEPIYEKDIIEVEVWDGKKWNSIYKKG